MEMNENKNMDCFDCALYRMGINVSCDSIRGGDHSAILARRVAILDLRLDPRDLAARGGR